MLSALMILEGEALIAKFRNSFSDMNEDWRIQFVQSAQVARSQLSQSFDVIVCDTAIADASELLLDAQTINRQSICIALAASPESEVRLECAALANYILPRQADKERIVNAVQRTQALRTITGKASSKLAGFFSHTLSRPPQLYRQIVEEAAHPDGSITQAASLVDTHPEIAAALLKTINAEFFGPGREVGSIDQAVYLLGFGLVRSILLSHLFFETVRRTEKHLPVDHLMRYSRYAGLTARKIARIENIPPYQADQAYIAASLQTVGMFILSHSDSKKYAKVMRAVRRKGLSYQKAELSVFGLSHAAVGGQLLANWGLSDDIVEAVTFQHNPASCLNSEFCVLSAVYAANALLNKLKYPPDTSVAYRVSSRYLLQVASAPAIAHWKEHIKLPADA